MSGNVRFLSWCGFLDGIYFQKAGSHAGATPQDVALAIMDAYQVSFPEFRGLAGAQSHCPELTGLDIVYPKDALPAPSTVVRRCAKLEAIGRAFKDVIVEDCESFRGFGSRLIVRGERRTTGFPQMPDNG
jgi:hypothetical protein